MLNSILTTLQVKVARVHIRYEDPGMGTPEQQDDLKSLSHCPPFCAGLVLDSLDGLSTDSSWNPSETSTSLVEALLYKLVRLSSLAAYVDVGDRSVLKACGVSDPSSRETPDYAAFMTMMADTAARRCDLEPHHYLLEPTGGSLKITLNRKFDNFSYPKVQAALFLQRIGLLVQPLQCHTAIFLLSRIESASTAKMFLKGKPKQRPNEAPRAWWKYAFDCVLEPIRRQRAAISAAGCDARRRRREEYVPLYVKFLQKPTSLSTSEKSAIERLERDSTFEEIMYFRALAEIDYKTSAALAQKQKSEQQPAKDKGIGSLIGSFFWGSSPVTPSEPAKATSEPTSSSKEDIWSTMQMTEDERNVFYEAINFDKPPQSLASAPADYVEYLVSWQNEAGQATIFDQNAQPLLAIGFHQLSANVSVAPKATNVSLSLQSLNANDLVSKDSLYPRLMYPQQKLEETLLKFGLLYRPNPGPAGSQDGSAAEADFEVTLALQRLNLVLNTDLMRTVTGAFNKQLVALSRSNAPVGDSDSSQTARGSYWSPNSWAQSEKRNQQLLSLASMNKSVNLDIVVSAPNVIIPRHCSQEHSPAVVLALGTFRLQTDASSASSTSSLVRTHPIALTNQPELKQEYYTLHTLEISDIHAIVTNTDRCGNMADVNLFTEEEQLFSPISATVTIAACKIASESLANLRISCFATPLHLRLSSTQVQVMSRVIVFVATEIADLVKNDEVDEKELATFRTPQVPRVQSTGWGGAVAFAETMVSTSKDEKPSSFGTGISLEVSSPDLRATFILDSTDAQPQQFDLELSSLGYAMESQSSSLTMKAVLGALRLVAANTQKPGETVLLLNSSISASSSPPSRFEDALIAIHLVNLKPSDPTYKNIDNDCVFTFRQLSAHLHPHLIRGMMIFIRTARDLGDRPRTAPPTLTPSQLTSSKSSNTIGTPQTRSLASSSSPESSRTEFLLRFRCEAIQLVLFDLDGLHLSESSLKNSEATFSIPEASGWKMSAVIGDFVILDTAPATSSVSTAESKRRLLSLDKPNSTEFEVAFTPSKDNDPSKRFNPDVILVSLKLNFMRVQLNPKWLFNTLLSLNELARAFAEIKPLANATVVQASNAPPILPDNISIVLLDITISQSRVFMPEDPSSSTFVVVDVGEARITSTIDEALPSGIPCPIDSEKPLKLRESITIALSRSDLFIGALESTGAHHSILGDSRLSLSLSSTYIPGSTQAREDSEIWLSSESLKLIITAEHAHILFRAVQHNLYYMPTDKEVSRRLSQATIAEQLALAANPLLYERSETTRPVVNSSFKVAFGALRIELSDSLDINSSIIQKRRLLGLEARNLECQTRMLSDDSLKVDFYAGQLSALDLRDFSTLPHAHPLYNHPELDNEDNRLFIFPTTGMDPQLVGSFTTLPSKNQTSVCFTLSDFQLLPEATIVQRLMGAVNPIVASMMTMLGQREAIMALTMAPKQKARYLSLKAHPETSTSYAVTLVRPEILLASRTEFGLKFSAMSPASIDVSFSQAPTNSLTQITIKHLSASFGTTTETERAKLFQLSKPSLDDLDATAQGAPKHQVKQYDILSPVSLEATLLLTDHEHQYAVHFRNQVRICSSYSDYLDVMELIGPFLSVEDNVAPDGESSESADPVFQLPQIPLGYDPSAIRYYPPATFSTATNDILSLIGMTNVGSGVASQGETDNTKVTIEELNMEEDDLYTRIMSAANNAEESWFQQHAAAHAASESDSSPSSSGASSATSPSLSRTSSSTGKAMLLNPALSPQQSSVTGVSSPSAPSPSRASAIPSQAPSDLSISGDSYSVENARTSLARATYIPKRLSIGSLRLELMVMDNQQSDLGLVRLKMDFVTLRLHNWDAEAFKKSLLEDSLFPQAQLSYTQPPANLPVRTAQLEARVEADCFAPLVSAWEPLLNPYRFEVIINGRDLRVIAASALNLVISENFLLNYKRIVAVLDTENPSQDLSASRSTTSAPDRMRSQHMHYINNCTGQHLQYELVESVTQQRSSARVLAPGLEEALSIPMEWAHHSSSAANTPSPLAKADRAELAVHRVHFTLSIMIANHNLQNIDVNKVGCRVLTIDELRSVVVNVQYQQGVKVITLKSRVSLHNNTGVPLVVGLELGTVDVSRASQLPSLAASGRSGTTNGAVTQITSSGRVTTISQICSIEPYSWYHVPIDIIHDGILRFRPGATGEFVSFNAAQRAQQSSTDYTYQWGNYRCELRNILAHKPVYMVCMPRAAEEVLGVGAEASSASMLNPFHYSTGVCRVATKSSIIAGSDEFVLHFQPPLVLENLLPSQAEYLINEVEPSKPRKSSSRSSQSSRTSSNSGRSPSASSRSSPFQASGRDSPDEMPLLPTVGRIDSGQRVALHNLSPSRHVMMGLAMDGFEWSEKQIIRFPENGPRYFAPGEDPPFGAPELPTALDLPEMITRGASGPIETAKRSTRIELENQMLQLGTRLVTFYAKYWVVNKTGLPLLTAADSRNPAAIGAGMLSQFNKATTLSDAPLASTLSSTSSPSKLDSASPLLGLSRALSTNKGKESTSRLPLSSLFDSQFSAGCVEALAPAPNASANPIFSSRSSTIFSPNAAKLALNTPVTHRPMIYKPGGDVDNEKMCVKVQGSKWSVPLPLESAANGLSRITVKGEDVALVDTGSTLKLGILGSSTKLRKFFDLSLNIGPAADRFWRTTVLSFAPRYMFTNKLSVPILFRCSNQTSSTSSSPSTSTSGSPGSISSKTGSSVHTEGILMPGETAPWHWIGASGNDRLATEAVEMRLDLPNCSWSGPMLLETRVMTTVAMFNPEDGSRIFVRLMPRMHSGTGITTIIFKQEELENPLFKIVNRTPQSISVRQKGFTSIPSGSSKHAPSPPYAAAFDTIPALDSRIWGWYSPSTIENGLEIAFVHGNRLPKAFSLTKVRSYPNALARVGDIEFEVSLSVSTDKTTRILVIEPVASLRQRTLASPAYSFDRRTTSSPGAGVQQRVQPRTRGRETSINPLAVRSTTTLPESASLGDFADLTASNDSFSSGYRSGIGSVGSLSSGSSSGSFDPVPSDPDEYDWKIGLALQSISASLINGEPEEVLFGVVAHIGVEVILYPKRRTFEVQIGDLQVDNQDPMTFYPVAIASSGSRPRYWLQFSLIRSTEYPDIICQPLVSLLIKETHVKVDEVLILKLLDLYTARRWREVTHKPGTAKHGANNRPLTSSAAGLSSSNSAVSSSASNPAAWLSGTSQMPESPSLVAYAPEKLLISNENVQMLGLDEDESKMVYTEFALLNPIHLFLSFQFTQRTTDDARELVLKEQRILKQSRYDPESWRGFGVPREFPALEAFLRSPLTGIFTFERAPIFFSCLLVEHSFVSYNVLYDTVVTHYSSQAIKFVMTVGGSLDVAGDPISLAYNLGSGVRDLFYEPAKGIAISPLAFGQGLGRGGAKFAKKSLYGIFNTINKGFHTLGTAAAFVSFDSDYRAKRAQRKQREQPKNVAYGVGQGAFEFSKGLFDGITGLVVQPIAGAQKEGAAGFFKGFGKGAAGLVVKPVVGALDLVQRTAEGIKNTTSDFVQTQRCRWPLYIAEDGIVRTYSRAPALAMRILHSIENEEYAHELYCGYFRCTVAPGTNPDALLGTLLIASSQQLIFVSATEKPPAEQAPSKRMLIPPAQTPNLDVKWQIPLRFLKNTDYILDQVTKTTGQFIFIRSDRMGRQTIRLDGTLDRFQSLSTWVSTLVKRHKLLYAFFKDAMANEDD